MAEILRGPNKGMKMDIVSMLREVVYGKIGGKSANYKITALKFDPDEYNKIVDEINQTDVCNFYEPDPEERTFHKIIFNKVTAKNVRKKRKTN